MGPVSSECWRCPGRSMEKLPGKKCGFSRLFFLYSIDRKKSSRYTLPWLRGTVKCGPVLKSSQFHREECSMKVDWSKEHCVFQGRYESLYLLRPVEYAQRTCVWAVVREPDQVPIRWIERDGSAYMHLVMVHQMEQEDAHKCLMRAINWFMERSFELPPSAKGACADTAVCGQ